MPSPMRAFTFFMFLSVAFAPGLSAQAKDWQHGLSLYGAPDMARGFKHFSYVNPKAPKGGAVKIAAIGSFDNLNQFTIKGNACLLYTSDAADD